MNIRSILQGINVLDLSTVLAGPSVGTFLAELGARVTKIESPQGDITRTWFGVDEDQSTTSAYYLSVNALKNVQVMDLNENKSELEELISKSDILLLNFKSSDEIKFDLKPDVLLKRHPHLIIGKIKGFEHEEGRVAYDVAIQAETGYMSINGEKNSEPLKLPVAFMDVLAAHQLKEGLLCALLDKTKTGKGMLVECSLESAGIVSLMNQGSNFLKTGKVPIAAGSLHPNIAPYGEQIVFKDNTRIVLAIGSDKQFTALCNVLQCDAMAIDQRFHNNISRVQNRIDLIQILTKSAKDISFQSIRETLISHSIPFGEVKTIDQVLDSPSGREKTNVHPNGERSVSHIGFSIIK